MKQTDEKSEASLVWEQKKEEKKEKKRGKFRKGQAQKSEETDENFSDNGTKKWDDRRKSRQFT